MAIAVVSGTGQGITDMNAYPLLIEFVPGTRITREPEVVRSSDSITSARHVCGFRDGAEVPLPTGQIDLPEDCGGSGHGGSAE